MVKESLKIEEEKLEKSASSRARKFADETKKQIVTAWTAALGLVLALAWNSVFQSFFQAITTNLFKQAPSYLAPILSACLTTILVVVGIIVLNKWASKPAKVPESSK